MEDKVSVASTVTAEQQHVLDSIAVRIMKTRKTLSHQVKSQNTSLVYKRYMVDLHVEMVSFITLQDLVQDILSQCYFFRPDIRKVKQRLEDLMKRGFIKREDPTIHTSPYVYVPGDD